jgi:hypothetical protein
LTVGSVLRLSGDGGDVDVVEVDGPVQPALREQRVTG